MSAVNPKHPARCVCSMCLYLAAIAEDAEPAAPSEGPTPALPVPAQEADAEDLDLVADYLDPDNGPYLDGDDAKALANRLHNLAARLRSPSEIPEAERLLRQLVWLNHGCDGLYGDDGEMQCGRCRLDFKRDPVEEIDAQTAKHSPRQMARLPLPRGDTVRLFTDLTREVTVTFPPTQLDRLIAAMREASAYIRFTLPRGGEAFERAHTLDTWAEDFDAALTVSQTSDSSRSDTETPNG